MNTETAPADVDELGAGSASWNYLAKWRFLLVMHRTLVLQTAYPAVGAAVGEFSVYQAKPWRRLFHTLDSLQLYVYGTQAERRREIARLERLHRRMRGIDGRGRPYTAADPAARMWVHLTLFEAVLHMHRMGGDPLPRAEAERLYAEWCRLGARFGLSEADLPATVDDFNAYFDRTVATVLEDNPAVRDLLSGSIHHVPPPPGLPIPALLWAPIRRALTTAAVETTVATLPPDLRRTLGLTPLPGSVLATTSLHHAVRLVADLLPKPWRYLPHAAAAIRATLGGPRSHAPMDPALLFTTVLDQTGEGEIRWNDLLAMARELAVHLDVDEAAENELHDAFEAWWRQLSDATGGADVVALPRYQAAIAEGRYPGDAAGVERVVATICTLIDRNDNGEVPEAEYVALFADSPKRHEIISDLRTLDRNGDGVLRTAELATALREFLTGSRDFPAARELFSRA